MLTETDGEGFGQPVKGAQIDLFPGEEKGNG